MVIVKLYGGLGNQLFQYATAYALAKKHQTQLMADLSWFHNQKKQAINRPFLLDKLGINTATANHKHLSLFFPKTQLKKLQKKILRRMGQLVILYEHEVQLFKPEVKQAPKHTYLNGFWQTEKYFKEYATNVISQISFGAINTSTRQYGNNIANKNSVSLHVRRGDYISDNQTNKIHGVCAPDYYYEAFEKLSSRVKTDVQYIFSDDIAWCKQHLSWLPNPAYCESNTATYDLFLMSKCKHNIIANSSFSWWGAWLNQNPDKIVIAPERWFANEKLQQQCNDIVPEKWQQV